MAGLPKEFVTEWRIETAKANTNLKKMSGKLSTINTRFQELHSKISLAMGAFNALGGAVGGLLTRGAQLERLQRMNTLSIKEATIATAGYLSKMDLLKAANMATAFGLGFTEQQFAKLSSAAVLMSQRLGTDANKAIGDLVVGMSRGSKKILDNLGIIIKGEYEHGKVLREVSRLTDGYSLSTETAGDQLEIFKNKLKDALDELGKTVSKSGLATEAMDNLAISANAVKEAFEKFGFILDGFLGKESNMVRMADNVIRAWGPILRAMGQGAIIDAYETARDIRAAQLEADVGPQFRGGGTLRGAGAGGAGGTVGTGISGIAGGKGSRVKGWNKKKKRGGGGRGPSAEGMFDPGDLTHATGEFRPGVVDEGPEAFGKFVSGTFDRQLDAARLGIDAVTASMMKAWDAQEKWDNAMKEQNQTLEDLVIPGLASMGGAIWSAAEAAMQGGERMDRALAKAFKNRMLAIAGEASVMALMAFGKWAFSGFMDMSQAIAFGKFTAAAVAAGGVGLAVSAALGGGGGGGASAPSSSGAGTYRPSYGRKVEQKQQNIVHVDVYLGAQGDPGAVLYATEQVKAAIRASQ